MEQAGRAAHGHVLDLLVHRRADALLEGLELLAYVGEHRGERGRLGDVAEVGAREREQPVDEAAGPGHRALDPPGEPLEALRVGPAAGDALAQRRGDEPERGERVPEIVRDPAREGVEIAVAGLDLVDVERELGLPAAQRPHRPREQQREHEGPDRAHDRDGDEAVNGPRGRGDGVGPLALEQVLLVGGEAVERHVELGALGQHVALEVVGDGLDRGRIPPGGDQELALRALAVVGVARVLEELAGLLAADVSADHLEGPGALGAGPAGPVEEARIAGEEIAMERAALLAEEAARPADADHVGRVLEDEPVHPAGERVEVVQRERERAGAGERQDRETDRELAPEGPTPRRGLSARRHDHRSGLTLPGQGAPPGRPWNGS